MWGESRLGRRKAWDAEPSYDRALKRRAAPLRACAFHARRMPYYKRDLNLPAKEALLNEVVEVVIENEFSACSHIREGCGNAEHRAEGRGLDGCFE